MVLNRRFKLLCGIAAAIAVYLLVSSPDVATPARATPGGVREHAGPTPEHHNVSSTSGPDASSMLARLSRRVSDDKGAPALFHSQSWYVAPPAPAPEPVVAAPPPPPPTAPPMPFTVMGSYARPGDIAVYFLTRGDRVFDVRVGDTIDHVYSVDSAANGQLLLTYLPLKIQQTLAVGGPQ